MLDLTATLHALQVLRGRGDESEGRKSGTLASEQDDKRLRRKWPRGGGRTRAFHPARATLIALYLSMMVRGGAAGQAGRAREKAGSTLSLHSCHRSHPLIFLPRLTLFNVGV